MQKKFRMTIDAAKTGFYDTNSNTTQQHVTETPGDKLPSQYIRMAENELDIKTGVTHENDMKDLKFLLSTSSAATFNTNVLRIALNMQEEKIACLIVSKYSAKIDEEMVNRACRSAQLNFLYTLFSHNKNYQELMSEKRF